MDFSFLIVQFFFFLDIDTAKGDKDWIRPMLETVIKTKITEEERLKMG